MTAERENEGTPAGWQTARTHGSSTAVPEQIDTASRNRIVAPAAIASYVGTRTPWAVVAMRWPLKVAWPEAHVAPWTCVNVPAAWPRAAKEAMLSMASERRTPPVTSRKGESWAHVLSCHGMAAGTGNVPLGATTGTAAIPILCNFRQRECRLSMSAMHAATPVLVRWAGRHVVETGCQPCLSPGSHRAQAPLQRQSGAPPLCDGRSSGPKQSCTPCETGPARGVRTLDSWEDHVSRGELGVVSLDPLGRRGTADAVPAHPSAEYPAAGRSKETPRFRADSLARPPPPRALSYLFLILCENFSTS